MKKKTATITWIKYNNYGTFLQAYALQNTLETNKLNNIILDDENINNRKINEDKKTPKVSYVFIKKVNKLLRQTIYFYDLFLKRKYKRISDNRNKQFEKFKKNYLKVSKPVVYTELSKLNNEYDGFICGSDQIWSPKDEVFNEYYYLGFVNDEKLKISYAPSIGLNQIPFNKKEKISELINRFNYISIREEQGANLLKELTNKNIEVVLDPTLLINSAQWESIMPKKNNKTPYILCYFLGEKKWYREYLKKFSKSIGLKIIVIPMLYKDVKLGDCSEGDGGPQDFLRLLFEADYIFTDSLHGTIFSILFNKKFITFERFDNSNENCQNSRIYNLLNKLNLLNRFIGDECTNIDFIKSKINYDNINEILEKERKKSLNFLIKAVDKI